MLYQISYLMEDNEEYIFIVNTNTPEKAEQYVIEELIKMFGSIGNTTQGELSVSLLDKKEGLLASFWLKPDN